MNSKKLKIKLFSKFKKIQNYLKPKHGKCNFSEYQNQQNDSLYAKYVLYIIYWAKVSVIYFTSAVLNLYYQTTFFYKRLWEKEKLKIVLDILAKMTNCKAKVVQKNEVLQTQNNFKP